MWGRPVLGTARTVARPVWSGTSTFGWVNVPVEAHSAVRDHDVHFHRSEQGTGSRISHQKLAERSGKEVDIDDIELGFDIRRGRYVTFDRDELAERRPESARAVELTDFVGLSEIDGLPRRAKPHAANLRIATQLLHTMSSSWDPRHDHATGTRSRGKRSRRRAAG